VSKANKRERQRQNRELARIERERMLKRQRQTRALRSFLYVFVPLIAIVVVISLVRGGDDGSSNEASSAGADACGTPVADPQRTFSEAPPQTIDAAAKYTALVCTSEGNITLSLDAGTAPVATNNFVFLARNGFYDGLDFHRAAKGFVIQGGDPSGDGSGGPGYTVQGEVPTDNYPVGSLAGAKTGNEPPGTFGSQFFIVTGSAGKTLPNDYARFGTVTKGLDVAKKIESYAPDGGDGPPTKKVRIVAVQIREDGTVLEPTTTTTTPAESTPSSS
jgi:cyclophilin family peptidyl-prolyl cis-trans isomerase